MDKHKQSALSNNLNYRHKMAQYAQRASVAFHTQVLSPNRQLLSSALALTQTISFQLFFKSRGILNEKGFVLFVRKNAIIVLIPRFGLEGTVFFDTKDKSGPRLVFDEEVRTPSFPVSGAALTITPAMFEGLLRVCV